MRRKNLILILILLLFYTNISFAQEKLTSAHDDFSKFLTLNRTTNIQAQGGVIGNSGAYGYRYNIPLPPGRNGMSPQLALQYSSSAGRSYLGLGWSLNIPYIVRSTKFGKPNYIEEPEYQDGVRIPADQFDFHDASGSVHHLIPVEKNGDEIWYRSMRESDFSWFKYDQSDEYWIVLTKNGHKFEFGNPASPYNASAKLGFRAPFKWFINRHEDTVGNYVSYYYTPEGGNEIPRIKQIHYTNNSGPGRSLQTARVDFEEELNDDYRIVNYRFGTQIIEDRYIITSILVYVRNTYTTWTLRKKIELEIVEQANIKILKSITLKGYDNSTPQNESQFPSITFHYQPIELKRTKNIKVDSLKLLAWWKKAYSDTKFNDYYGNITRTYFDLIDLNGDGLMDCLESNPEERGFNVYYGYTTDGKVWRRPVDPSAVWRIPDELYSRDIERSCPIRATRHKVDRVNRYSNVWFDMIDMNGDGLPDYVYDEFGESSGSLLILFNHRTSFDTEVTEWERPSSLYPSALGYRFTDYDGGAEYDLIRMTDLNGDGLPDIIDNECWNNDHPYFNVYFNKGNGFSTEPIKWQSPIQNTYKREAIKEYDSNNGWTNYKRTHIDLQDINGDGLKDLLNQPDSQNCSENLIVYFNDGDSFIPYAHKYEGIGCISVTETKPCTGLFGEEWEIEEERKVFLQDFNGDGLPDYYDGYAPSPDCFFKQNNGVKFINGISDDLCRDSYFLFLLAFSREKDEYHDYNDWEHNSLEFIPKDRNGDGFLYSGDPVKLSKINNGHGAETIIEYTTASSTENPNIPYPDFVVKSITTKDCLTNHSHTVDYRYSDGIFDVQVSDGGGINGNYFDVSNKEFRGYAKIAMIDIARSLEITTLYNNSYLYGSGLPYDYKVINTKDNSIFMNKVITYSEYKVADPLWQDFRAVCFVYPQRLLTKIYNGESQCTFLDVSYDYDQYGNLIRIYNDGLDLNQMEDEDDRYTDFEYKCVDEHATGKYICAPKSVKSYYMNADTWELISKMEMFHDNSTDINEITQGLLTQIRLYHSDSTYITNDFEYDNQYGLLEKETDQYGAYTRYSYDWSKSYASLIRKPGFIHKFRYGYDLGSGNMTFMEDQNESRWTFKYDGLDRPVHIISPESDTLQTIEYADWEFINDNMPNYIHTKSLIDKENNVANDRRIYYDGNERPIESHSSWDEYEQQGEKRVRSVYFGRDSVNRIDKIYQPTSVHDEYGYSFRGIPSENSGLYFSTQVVYDPLDRLVKLINQYQDTVATVNYRYNLSVEQKDAEGFEKIVEYDAYGNMIRTIDDPNGLNVQNKFIYNGNNQIIKAIGPEVAGMTNEIEYSYDLLGRLVTVKLPGFEDDKEWRYHYDVNGKNITRRVSPAGREIVLYGDDYGRTIQRDYLERGVLKEKHVFEYDKNNIQDGFLLNKGRLTSALVKYYYPRGDLLLEQNGTKTNYDYDRDGNVVRLQLENLLHKSDNVYSILTSYNDNSSLKSITYPDGSVYKYTYWPDGNVRSLKRLADNKQVLKAWYNWFSQLNFIIDKQQYTTSYQHDRCGRLISMELEPRFKEEIPWTRHIEYYKNGLIKSIADEMNSEFVDSVAFNYDRLFRVSSDSGTLYKTDYSYDNASRITHVTRNGNLLTYRYQDNRFPWAVTRAGGITIRDIQSIYTYDDDGFVTSKQRANSSTTSFTYNTHGRLSQISQIAVGSQPTTENWQYDHAGNMVHHSKTGTFSSDYVGELFEKSYGIEQIKKYLIFAGQRRAYEDENGELHYYHLDQKGSVTLITNENGDEELRQLYYPFGDIITSSGNNKTGYGYEGKKQIEPYGLYRTPFRIQSVESRQWLSFDPLLLVEPSAVVATGTNPYAYAGNNPIIFSDQSGLFIDFFGSLWGPIIGSIFGLGGGGEGVDFGISHGGWGRQPDPAGYGGSSNSSSSNKTGGTGNRSIFPEGWHPTLTGYTLAPSLGDNPWFASSIANMTPEEQKRFVTVVGIGTGIAITGAVIGFVALETAELWVPPLLAMGSTGVQRCSECAQSGGRIFQSVIQRGLRFLQGPSAYEIANQGGRHHGQLQQFRTWTPDQIQKTLRSLNRLINEHELLIQNPWLKHPSWESMHPLIRENIIHHWQQDIQRAIEFIDIIQKL